MTRLLRLFVLLAISALSSPVAAQPLERLSISELEARIAAGDFGKVAALAAEQGGTTIYRQRFDGKAAGTPIDIRSAGKSITAIAVGMAIEDGALAGTDVAVWPFLDSARGEPFDTITVNDLLGMSSALDCNDWDKSSPGQEDRMYRKRIWRDHALALPARQYERSAKGEGPFSYCTAGVFLLGQVVEKATGERFDAYVQRRLFDPLGIEGVKWKRSRSGEVQSGGQLTISDEALLRIGRMVLNKGLWNGERLVSEEWITRMLTSRHALSSHVHYASLWWITPLAKPGGYTPALMMKGNGGNIVALVPEYDAVLVVQAENYNRDMAERAAFTALAAMLATLDVPTQ